MIFYRLLEHTQSNIVVPVNVCVYDGLEPHNQYEPQQDTNNPIPTFPCNHLFFQSLNKYLHLSTCRSFQFI
jgi:hypothetical protein